MDDNPNLIQEAAEALTASGRTAEPIGDDHPLWVVAGERQILTDEELLALACELRLLDEARQPH